MKNTEITLNDCNSEMLAAIQGGEGTSFNLLSTPDDYSVSIKKLATAIRDRDSSFN